ncbi:MAG TPA: low molecular weight protein-tyrosine-phosphatase [Anaerolineae bacterium]|nr:low molecular weight protein-tyrosine-phosphatase [Anaerolineae bacterium]
MVQVVFVCLGNICRSPMADAVFQQMVKEAGLAEQIQVDSAGTGGWHAGEKAHRGTRQILAKHGVPYDGRARQVAERDMTPKTYVIAMDSQNKADLEARFGTHPRLHMLLSFAERAEVIDVPDPYYTGNFDYVYELVSDGCRGLLAHIRAEEGL